MWLPWNLSFSLYHFMDNLTKKSLDFEDFEAKIKLPWRIIETKEEQEFDTHD